MRIFVTGGTGAIGNILLPMLVRDGHEVVALVRSTGKAVHVGARLTTTLPDIAAIRANRYWEPVVWNVVDAACP